MKVNNFLGSRRKKVSIFKIKFKVGFVFPRNGFEDPDPYQSETDPKHCLSKDLYKVFSLHMCLVNGDCIKYRYF